MKIQQSLIFVTLVITAQGCASAPRVLSVKSFPAEAEVCIKGKPGHRYFKQVKNCIGTTPLELESVLITDDSGKKRTVNLRDLDPETEQFYLVVSRPGYAPQSMSVPGWDHFVTLQQEPQRSDLVTAAPSAKGSAKISSDPVGAVVYVNDFLKGNTPYLLEGEPGQTIRLKIEQAGYHPIERSITFEGARAMEINLAMEKEEGKATVAREEGNTLPIQQAAK